MDVGAACHSDRIGMRCQDVNGNRGMWQFSTSDGAGTWLVFGMRAAVAEARSKRIPSAIISVITGCAWPRGLMDFQRQGRPREGQEGRRRGALMSPVAEGPPMYFTTAVVL